MKRGATIFLQIVLIAVGIGVFAALLWEPQVEGVNANATSLQQIYFDDPFLAYIYTAFIAFFVALYQAVKVLGYIRSEEAISEPAIRALRIIKYCSLIFAGFIVGAEVMIMANHGEDDAAGGVMMGAFMILVALTVAANAAVHERIWRKAMEIKSENELTV